ncbi:tRNA (cytosine(32)/uridine(32)-2'-O)-methyltransferase TrmJ [Pseudoalteromonas luteoviolacea]|uniref:tRNA (cytidine/uridine-2'-O-)-methyltransferase TrmJ n=1 Tax=Pseudoalteromonas luteoviolacea DSM 6061 TaxID=1365250 RepID=A0A166W142_9GAMM|nr:tRNA (cytosine(32)/uridine(32)-2'-O)-methyltransferase TrmJ [Pseudoalteromonas luteoviolacea]KZN35154.1 tRNA methyltransferase [Pseudoalteromonas luteoviolacea DSM 6061]KZN52905.1 tRNA methyltransferase [Pseudoalteromonas luteoviolacea CPMOR-2]MBE0384898.1 tRNA (cytidine32/uridine32-2'-O)-methyltransferase [Pseudoalteromonas luteoviolacea DSM 6061]TQF66591.1 tRNA (cytosine(32)/uridine(32)-2'-O)-methyltransferase TrmJ [Pseudoalteromonas luteoviolacea]
MALQDIRIVLVNTSHSGNIGSVARAMKTMGFSQLYLVDPACEVDSHASALAAGATDVLGNAVTVGKLEDAIADCSLVIGTSARSRTLSWPMVDPRECAQKLVAESASGPVALVFGRENSGLTNEELQLCNYHVCIPANPDYSSLNLAMAVQTLTYETRMTFLDTQDVQPEEDDTKYPTSEQMELFYEHLESTLNETGFIVKQHPGMVMTKLKRLFNRARPEDQELNILRGILSSVNKSTKQNHKD